MGRGVFLMTVDPLTERSVVDALRSDRSFAVASATRSIPELVRQMNGSPPPVVVVDVDPQPERMLAMLDPVISRFNSTRFIVLGKEASPQLLLEAMKVGARHFVTKDLVGRELAGVLNRVLPTGGPGGVDGCLITVLAASGGVGATLLAVNLANELRLLGVGPALLADLDPWSPAVGGYLGMQTSGGLDSVLADASRIDGELIRSAAGLYEGSLHVLDSPSRSTHAEHPAVYDSIARFLEVCREHFAFSVFDAPRLPLQVAAQLASVSSVTLLPFQGTVPGIARAKDLINALGSQGIDGVIPVMNRYRKRGVLVSYDETCRALGRDNILVIENDWEPAAESVNLGKPLAALAPRSTLRKAIAHLAGQLHGARTSGRPYTLSR